jgi:hypothetical protein
MVRTEPKQFGAAENALKDWLGDPSRKKFRRANVESFSIRQASRSFFVVPFRLELPTSSTCTLKPSFQDWFSCLILPAQLAIALNMAMMIPTPRIEPIDVEASRIGNNGPIATRRMDIANASMGQLGTDDGDQD